MADYGIKISKTGFNVRTASDNDLVFSSKFNTLKAFMSGTITIPVNAVDVIDYGEVSHGLSYAPSFMCFNDGDDGFWHYVNSGGLQFYVSPNYEMAYAYSIPTYLEFVAENMFGVGIENRFIKYFIFKDEAQ